MNQIKHVSGPDKDNKFTASLLFRSTKEITHIGFWLQKMEIPIFSTNVLKIYMVRQSK
jgi:hypothetical protein